MKHRGVRVFVGLFLLSACTGGGDDDGVTPDGGGGGGDGGGGMPDADTSGFEVLAEGPWELGPGDEKYFCVRKTVSEELLISAFAAINPLGTHHTVVTVGSPSGPDGTTECNTFDNHDVMIFGSGVGTNPIEFPAGVAMRIAPGQQVLVNLHVYNASDEMLSGVSGTRFKRAEGQVDHIAEAILMGKVSLFIPPGESTQVGSCSMNRDVTLFAVSPHMHQLGTYLKVVAKSSVVGDVNIHDEPYDFDNQILHLVSPVVPMKQGDLVEVHCTYNNTTGGTVLWGESSDEEMCFAGVYRYPAGSSNFTCAN